MEIFLCGIDRKMKTTGSNSMTFQNLSLVSLIGFV